MELQSGRLGVLSRLQEDKDLFTDEKNIVHIQVQQRNGRKCITTIYGIATDLDLHKIAKYMKKFYNTNGHVVSDSKLGDVIQLQGDQRKNVYESLIDWKIANKEDIRVHGG